MITEKRTWNVDEIGVCLGIYGEYSFTQGNSSTLHPVIRYSNYMATFELICLPRICILILLNSIIICSKICMILFFCHLLGISCIYIYKNRDVGNHFGFKYHVQFLCIAFKYLYGNNGRIFLKII